MIKRLTFGLILLILGMVILLQNLEIMKTSFDVFMFWPVILIGIGISNIVDEKSFRFWNIVLLIVGSFFLLKNLDVIDFDFSKIILPSLIILGAVALMLPKPIRVKNISSNESYINQTAIFSGVDDNSYKLSEIKGGSITAIFGGINTNLTDTKAYSSEIVIDATAIFGGITLIVPKNWNVVFKGFPIFGGFDNKTVAASYVETTLIINGFTAFGGIEVKN